MRTRVWGLAVGVAAILGGRATASAAADEALLVVVEASPDVGVDAGEIRRAIAAEIHLPAVAPADPEFERADRALIVGVARNQIGVALRSRYAASVIRVIPASLDRSARVRAISWLAGNLVRDQVTGIVAGAAPRTSQLGNMPALAAPEAAGEVRAPPQPPPEPPLHAAPVVTSGALAAPAPLRRPRWNVTLEAGPALLVGVIRDFPNRFQATLPVAALWRVELRRFSDARDFFVAVSAEGTTAMNSSLEAPEYFGAAGGFGWIRRHGPWAFEGTAGVGVDVGPSRSSLATSATLTSTMSSQAGFTASTTVTDGVAGGAYGTAAVAVSHTAGDAANLFLRVGAHLSTVQESDWFVSSTFGVSYGLW